MRNLLCHASWWLVFVIVPSIVVMVNLPESWRFWASFPVTGAFTLLGRLAIPFWKRRWSVD